MSFLKSSISILLYSVIGLVFITTSCKKDEPTIGSPPSQADAQFTYSASASSDNIIEFTASNSSLQAQWDFGNGTTGAGTNASATYPYAGTYSVKLTVFNSGGSASSTQDVTIANDDPSLLNNPLYDLLTGGASGPGYKVWAVDSATAGHMGVGPNPSGAAGNFPEWWEAGANEKKTAGMYDDRYTFSLQGFTYDMVTNGDVYINTGQAGVPPMTDTSVAAVGDFTAQFPNQMGENWTLTEGADTTITFSGDAFAGYWAGAQTYQIISIDTNELFVRYVDQADPALAWYIRLVPEGYVSGGGGGPEPTFSLPMDFEIVEPIFTGFGNSTAAVIGNPDATGINTSSKVLETVHGDETWSGISVNLDSKLDFSTQTTIKFKVWAPATGVIRVKMEDQADPNSFVEVDTNITVANSWQEITVDFSGSPTSFDKLVLFPGWNVVNAGTYYIDDIKQD